MTVLPLVIAPDPRLKEPSAPVEAITGEVRTLVANMFETMYAHQGIGLAAVQIGVMKRVIVVDVLWARTDGEKRDPIALINPEITWASDELSNYQEGCLSFPEHYSDVERPARVKIRYLDLEGNTKEIEAGGLFATCVQHEIDHTNGVVFVDHISSLKRDVILRKLRKAKKLGQLPERLQDGMAAPL